MSNTKYEINNDITLEIKDVRKAVKDEYGQDIEDDACKTILDFLMDNWDDDEYDADDIDGHIISALDHLIEDTKCIDTVDGKFVLDWK